MEKYISYIALSFLCYGSFLSCKLLGTEGKNYTDIFSINVIAGEKKLKSRHISQNFREHFDLFIKDAKRYKRYQELGSIENLRKLKFAENRFFQQNENILALCSHPTELKAEKTNKNLFKPINNWAEVIFEKKRYNDFVAGDKMRAKYVLYHTLFHCFFKEGHLPEGAVGIMEKDFYDPHNTSHVKSDAELVEELFSDKSFDILPDTR